mmetsp:Transcript_8891/g.21681  ORF Transcript_8891/g.21681 Transcript_8891/m.21681 type:complete len:389 (-) Transcript_8891:517-1683(-)|eukprot:g19785.t1
MAPKHDGGKQGQGGGKKGGGKGGGKPTLTQRVERLEDGVARIRGWNTISCKGFGLLPYHQWKKQTLEELATMDGKTIGKPAQDADTSGAAASGAKNTVARLLADSPGLGAASASQKTKKGTAQSAADVISWKEATVTYAEKTSASKWKTEILTTIVAKISDQVPMQGDTRYELKTMNKEGGGQYRERVDTGTKFNVQAAVEAVAEVEELVKFLSQLSHKNIDWVAINEGSQYADILCKNNHPAIMLHTLLQTEGKNPTEKYAFQAFIKENSPMTAEQRRSKEKKVRKATNNDQKKAEAIGAGDEVVDMDGVEDEPDGPAGPDGNANEKNEGAARGGIGVRKNTKGKNKVKTPGAEKKKIKQLQEQLAAAQAREKKLLGERQGNGAKNT